MILTKNGIILATSSSFARAFSVARELGTRSESPLQGHSQRGAYVHVPRHRRSFFITAHWCFLWFPYSAHGPRWGLRSPDSLVCPL